MNIKSQISFLIAILFMPFLVGFTSNAYAQDEPMAGIEASSVAIATVIYINKGSRIIKLRNEDGSEEGFIAGPEVRNFDQIKKGDVVITEFYTAYAIALGPKNGGIKERADELAVKRAKLGEKPGMEISQTDFFEGTVQTVDPKNRIVTIQGVENTVAFKVSPYVDLSMVKVGDEVEAAYDTFFAISVEPAPKVSGTVEMESTSVALGVGVEWGSGTLTMYDGSTYTFDIKGLSVIDLGISKVQAEGKIYKMIEPKDLEGTFLSAEAGAALGKKGASAMAMKNSKGVFMKLVSKQKGAKLTLAAEGLRISNIKPE